MLVIIGPSASGKTQVVNKLIEKYNMKKMVTYTTRPMRPLEVNGVDYYFISKSEFRRLKEQGFFAETAVYNGWYYGTAKQDCTNDKIAVLTPHGMRQLKKIKDIDIISFYINVPRRDRLIKILERGDDIEEAYRRSLSDVGQFDGIEDEVDYVINNAGYEKTITGMTYEILNIINKKINK